MFQFILDRKIYKTECWIQTGPMDFLIYLEDEDKFIDSKELSRDDFLHLLILNSNLKDTDIKHLKSSDIYDLKSINFKNLTFFELLEIYRRLNFNYSEKINSLKMAIISNMTQKINEYENEGKDCGLKKFKDLVRESVGMHPTTDDDSIRNLIEEFSIFLKIKAYSTMNLYELLNERDRFKEVISGKKSIDELGFPMVSKFVLEDRLYPALKVLITLKEDIYLLELLNFYREYEKLNPFTVKSDDFKNFKRERFHYDENASKIYNYSFFENLGIDTMFIDAEFNSMCTWQHQYICEYIYGLCASEINRICYYKNFHNKLKKVKTVYGRHEFVKGFLNYVYNLMNIS